jgi:shikimate kinase
MGVGKTTVGRLLAAGLNCPLVDSDVVIESREGRTGREIAESVGVRVLHDMEADVVSTAIRGGQRLVVAAAASVADQTSLLGSIRETGALVVYLDASPGALQDRLQTGGHRRTLDDPTAMQLAARRLRNTENNGGIVIDTDVMEPAEVVNGILAQITR